MIVFATCVVTALAQYAALVYPAHHAYAPAEHAIPYNFEYSVNDPHTYNVHVQSEYIDGNGYVKGTYNLLEADGSTSVVEYTGDDHSGFNAEVKRVEGHIGHKDDYSAAAPVYRSGYPASTYAPGSYKAY